MKRFLFALAFAAMILGAPLSARAGYVFMPEGMLDKYDLMSEFINKLGAQAHKVNLSETSFAGGAVTDVTLIGGATNLRIRGGANAVDFFDNGNPATYGTTLNMKWTEFSLHGNYLTYLKDRLDDVYFFVLDKDLEYALNFGGARANLLLGKGTVIMGFEDHWQGNDYDFNDLFFAVGIKPASVPVPAAVWLLGSGVAGLLALRRKNRA